MILLTGASGFVGSAVARRLVRERPQHVVCAARSQSARIPSNARTCLVGELAADTSFKEALVGVDVVIHAAARVHVMHDTAGDPLAEYRRVNVAGTLNLARQAAEAGARRFIFVSSIKVNGESTDSRPPFQADEVARPEDPYGVSKLEAEQGLLELAARSSMDVVIIRPPLVYGPGVGANFKKMMEWLHRGVPLPLGAIHNRRSLIALDNLVDLILTCIDPPAAANQVFLGSDGADLSTTELLNKLRASMDVRMPLLPVPAWLLRATAGVVGGTGAVQRLCGSLQVDIEKTRSLLAWQPPVAIETALQRTADSFLGKAVGG